MVRAIKHMGDHQYLQKWLGGKKQLYLIFRCCQTEKPSQWGVHQIRRFCTERPCRCCMLEPRQMHCGQLQPSRLDRKSFESWRKFLRNEDTGKIENADGDSSGVQGSFLLLARGVYLVPVLARSSGQVRSFEHLLPLELPGKRLNQPNQRTVRM